MGPFKDENLSSLNLKKTQKKAQLSINWNRVLIMTCFRPILVIVFVSSDSSLNHDTCDTVRYGAIHSDTSQKTIHSPIRIANL